MKSVLTEPIKQKLVLLLVLVAIGFFAITITEGYLRHYAQNRDQALQNQYSRRTLGRIILANLNTIELNLLKLVHYDDARDLRVVEQELFAASSDIEAIIQVLHNGGSYDYLIPTNFGNTNHIKELVAL